MGSYVGVYYSANTKEIAEFINNKQESNYNRLINSECIFIAVNNEFDKEKYFFENEKYVLLFSGSCFNEFELSELNNNEDAPSFAKVLVELFETIGTSLFKKIRGNFTLTLLDKESKQLYLIRDQFGSKMLYYKTLNNNIIFSDSQKSIYLNAENRCINEEALQHYLSFQYVPNPLTLTKGIDIVPSGNYLKIAENNELEFREYYERTFNHVLTDNISRINEIRNVLYDSVEKAMDGEESIGSFLSGGIDSTLIASIAKEIKPDLKTFSVGFEREGFSEIDIAEETADKLGLENISKVISPEEYVAKLPEIIWHLEDPLADPACVALYFVANEAKRHVDYALSGEGADEFFAGYNIYREPESLKIFNYIPLFVKDGLNRLINVLPDHIRGKSFFERGTTPLRKRYIGNAKIFEENEKKNILYHYNNDIHYTDITSSMFDRVRDEPLTTQMQYVDIHTWLPGDILLKANKMSAANSLTVRMPFVDIKVFDIARGIPLDLTITNNTTKNILREASRGIIPEHVLDRKKLGFPVPIRHWLKAELYDWAKQLIAESETEGLINKQYVNKLFEEHISGRKDLSRSLWTIFVFMLWHQVFVERKYSF